MPKTLSQYFLTEEEDTLVSRITYLRNGKLEHCDYESVRRQRYKKPFGMPDLPEEEIARAILIDLAEEQLNNLISSRNEDLEEVGKNYEIAIEQILLAEELVEMPFVKKQGNEKLRREIEHIKEQMKQHREKISTSERLTKRYDEAVGEAYQKDLISADLLVCLLKDGRITRSTLKRNDISIKELVKKEALKREQVFELEKRGCLFPKDVYQYLGVEQLIEMYKQAPTRKASILRYLPTEDAIGAYLNGLLSERDFLKTKVNIPQLIKKGEIAEDLLIQLCEKVYGLEAQESMVVKRLKEQLPNQEKVQSMYREDGYFSPASMARLAVIGLVSREEIRNIYFEQNKGYVPEEEKIGLEQLREIFSISDFMESLQTGNIQEEVLEFYKQYVLEEGEIEEVVKQLIPKLEESQATHETILRLYQYGILSEKEVSHFIDGDTLMEMGEEEKVPLEVLVCLAKNGAMPIQNIGLLIDEKKGQVVLVHMLEQKKLSLQELAEIQKILVELEAGLEQENLELLCKEPKTLVLFYQIGILPEQKWIELYRTGAIKEEEIFEACQTGEITEDVILDFYDKGMLSDNKLKVLNEAGRIEDRKTKRALNSLTAPEIEKRLEGMFEKKDYYLKELFPSPEEEKTREREKLEPTKVARAKKEMPQKTINPLIRAELIQELGATSVFEQLQERGGFKGYQLCYDEQDQIVIAESFVQNEANNRKLKYAYGNATYVFSLQDFFRMANKPRSEIVEIMQGDTDLNVKRVLHTKYWASNLKRAVQEIKIGKAMDLNFSTRVNELVSQMDRGDYSIEME